MTCSQTPVPGSHLAVTCPDQGMESFDEWWSCLLCCFVWIWTPTSKDYSGVHTPQTEFTCWDYQQETSTNQVKKCRTHQYEHQRIKTWKWRASWGSSYYIHKYQYPYSSTPKSLFTLSEQDHLTPNVPRLDMFHLLGGFLSPSLQVKKSRSHAGNPINIGICHPGKKHTHTHTWFLDVQIIYIYVCVCALWERKCDSPWQLQYILETPWFFCFFVQHLHPTKMHPNYCTKYPQKLALQLWYEHFSIQIWNH